MGVSGAGKTTVGRLLAESLGWSFHDADDLHPAENVRKMAAGTPLDEADRSGWLAAVRRLIDERLAATTAGEARGAVVACSALKRSHRRLLGSARRGVVLVHLAGTRNRLAERLRIRRDHWMPPSLLASQLRALEPPESALVVDVAAPAKEIARMIAERLGFVRGETAG